MSDRAQEFIVKLKSPISASQQRVEYLNSLIGSCVVVNATPLFPGESDEELASIYIVEVDRALNVDLNRVINTLLGQAEVDYAHQPSNRSPY